MRLRPRLCPGPRWGDYDAPPDPLVTWGGDTPSSIPSPFPTPGRLRRSWTAPSALCPGTNYEKSAPMMVPITVLEATSTSCRNIDRAWMSGRTFSATEWSRSGTSWVHMSLKMILLQHSRTVSTPAADGAIKATASTPVIIKYQVPVSSNPHTILRLCVTVSIINANEWSLIPVRYLQPPARIRSTTGAVSTKYGHFIRIINWLQEGAEVIEINDHYSLSAHRRRVECIVRSTR